MRRYSLFLGVLVVAGLVLSQGCKRRQSDQSGDILVGEFGSMTGTEASFGKSTHNGIMLAVDQANASGGVLGRKIKVIAEDDRSDQNEATTVVKKLINRDSVVCVLGEVASTRSFAGGTICEDAKVPMITPSSTNPGVTERKQYVFRVCFTDDFQGSADATFALKKGWKKVAILTQSDSDYSKGLTKYFKETFAKGGGQLVGDETYTGPQKDFKAQLQRIAQASPDAVYLPGYYTQIALILRQARLDVQLKVPFFGGDGWDSEETLKLGALADGCFFTNHYSADDPAPEVQAFVKAYKAKYNNEIPDAMAITGFDAANVLIDAIKRAGKTDPTAIRDAIAATKDFPGAGGTVTIDAAHNARKPIAVIEIRGGQFHLAEKIQPQ